MPFSAAHCILDFFFSLAGHGFFSFPKVVKLDGLQSVWITKETSNYSQALSGCGKHRGKAAEKQLSFNQLSLPSAFVRK